jgi:hypothetical protein
MAHVSVEGWAWLDQRGSTRPPPSDVSYHCLSRCDGGSSRAAAMPKRSTNPNDPTAGTVQIAISPVTGGGARKRASYMLFLTVDTEGSLTSTDDPSAAANFLLPDFGTSTSGSLRWVPTVSQGAFSFGQAYELFALLRCVTRTLSPRSGHFRLTTQRGDSESCLCVIPALGRYLVLLRPSFFCGRIQPALRWSRLAMDPQQ